VKDGTECLPFFFQFSPDCEIAPDFTMTKILTENPKCSTF